MKADEATGDLAEVLAMGIVIERALRKGVREALLRHKQAGCPVVVWQDGKSVWIAAEDIEIPAEDD